MSDFSLKEIAPFIEKDTRTLRRWCIAGVVPGAVETNGGHWRIQGESVFAITETILKNLPTTARRRRENAYPSNKAISSHELRARGITPRKAWQQMGEKLGNNSISFNGKRVRGWVIPSMIDKPWSIANFEWVNLDTKTERRIALEKAAKAVYEQRERDRAGEEYFLNLFMGILDKQNAGKTWDRVAAYEQMEKKKSLSWKRDKNNQFSKEPKLALKTPRFSATQLARQLSIPRRTFYRYFPNWKKILRPLWGEISEREEPDSTLP